MLTLWKNFVNIWQDNLDWLSNKNNDVFDSFLGQWKNFTFQWSLKMKYFFAIDWHFASDFMYVTALFSHVEL